MPTPDQTELLLSTLARQKHSVKILGLGYPLALHPADAIKLIENRPQDYQWGGHSKRVRWLRYLRPWQACYRTTSSAVLWPFASNLPAAP